VDRVPNTLKQNLERLAAALRELNARLRVGSMSDDEARRLPVVANAATSICWSSFEIATADGTRTANSPGAPSAMRSAA
jgi:hypothetical protein